MKSKPLLLSVLFLALSQSPSYGERLKPGDWIGSAGIGFMAAPSLLLISPHLEKVYRPKIFLGALLQAGVGNLGSLFTVTATARVQVGNHPRLRPTLEGGLGLAAASAAFASSVGVALHAGMGVDYLLEPDLAVSTTVRACFAPPVQSFFMSWPVVQVRYLF